LAGEWRCKDSARLSAIQPLPPGLPQEPDEVAWLYNGMVALLTPFALRGCIWYQGESNASRASQHRDLLAAMIQNWRARFAQPGLPFLIVQLANYSEPVREPGESGWAELREAQALVAETLPNSGLAVAIDIGDAKNIHPKNKKEVGRRLALVALSRVYGKKVEYSGPLYQSMSTEGSAIRLKFSHVGGGLIAKGGPLQQFAIAVPISSSFGPTPGLRKIRVNIGSSRARSLRLKDGAGQLRQAILKQFDSAFQYRQELVERPPRPSVR